MSVARIILLKREIEAVVGMRFALPEMAITPEIQARIDERAKELTDEVDRLLDFIEARDDPVERMIIIYHDVYGYSFDRIARKLGGRYSGNRAGKIYRDAMKEQNK